MKANSGLKKNSPRRRGLHFGKAAILAFTWAGARCWNPGEPPMAW